jgi:repressor LexA
MTEKPLSKRQQSILDFTQVYIGEHGRPPTIREIGRAVGISSTSVVNYNLAKLEEKGFLDRDPDVSRGLRLKDRVHGATVGVAHTADGALRDVSTTVRQVVERLVRIPLAGTIVASRPLEVGNDGFATFDEDDAIELSSAMLPGRVDGLYALRVSGDSMIDAMVNDGDIVIMRPQNEARNGDMVAVWLRGDTTTLKYFFQESGRIRLQPANPTMDPIFVNPGEVQVQGKVMMVLRQTA